MAGKGANLHSVMVKNVSTTPETFFDVKHKLQDVFSKFGEIGDVHLPKDRNFAFVRFQRLQDAEDAMKEMDGKDFEGDELRCQMATQPPKPGYPQGGRSRSRSRSRRERRRSPSRERRRRRGDSRDRRRRDSRSRRRR
ncbi:unnamed protein product [Prorocentrum cordatum]|uniref:RRM domain-containing protein n=1 Tax=Prorocentrum cordatum TaxID=2364126 RepID=A0ABN9SCT0_9DINO|nr:unnamed protein product [Polarella glacialis]